MRSGGGGNGGGQTRRRLGQPGTRYGQARRRETARWSEPGVPRPRSRGRRRAARPARGRSSPVVGSPRGGQVSSQAVAGDLAGVPVPGADQVAQLGEESRVA